MRVYFLKRGRVEIENRYDASSPRWHHPASGTGRISFESLSDLVEARDFLTAAIEEYQRQVDLSSRPAFREVAAYLDTAVLELAAERPERARRALAEALRVVRCGEPLEVTT